MIVTVETEIWRSQLHPYYKHSFKVFIAFGVYLNVFPIILMTIIIIYTTNLTYRELMIVFVVLEIPMGSIATLLLWIGVQFTVSYLIIYENGIKIRKPYRLLKQKFVPFDLIQDVKIRQTPWYYGSSNIHKFEEMIIFVKNQNPIKLTSAWVDKLHEAEKIISKYAGIK